MVRAEDHRVAAVEPEGDAALAAFALASHLDRAKGGALDLDVELLDRRDQHVPSVGLAPEDGREQPHHRGPADRRALVIPACRRARCACREWPQRSGFHLIDRRQPPLVDQLLKLGEAEPCSSIGGRLSGMASSLRAQRTQSSSNGGLLRSARNDRQRANRNRHRRRQARRLRRSRAALLADGWAVVAHVHHDDDEVPEGASRSSPISRTQSAPRRSSRRRTACRRCGCWSTMPRDSRGTASASSAPTSSTRIWRSTSARRLLLIERFAADAARRSGMRWSSICSIRSSPRPTRIISATLCRSRRWPA